MARAGRPTAVVERRWIGGCSPNVNCLPSKNEIWSAKVASLVRRSADYGVNTGRLAIDMAKVRDRKRTMVDDQIAANLQNYKDSGTELIMGSGQFVGPKTLEVQLNDNGTQVLVGDRVFINVGTRAAIPAVPGLEDAHPLTNIEALELDYLPAHLIVLGGGVRGARIRAGLSALRQQPHRDRARDSAHGRRGCRRLRGASAASRQPRNPVPGGRRDRANESSIGKEVSLAVHTRTVSKRLRVATSWSRLDASRTPPTSASTGPASSWTLTASFASTSGWRPVHPMSGPSVNARGVRSSRTCRRTTSGSSGTTWPEARAARAVGWFHTACSRTLSSPGSG
jgi:hypothetical protein